MGIISPGHANLLIGQMRGTVAFKIAFEHYRLQYHQVD
jgi:hypothetical protein